MKNKITPQPRVMALCNIYRQVSHGGFGGEVLDPEGICRTLGASHGSSADTWLLIRGHENETTEERLPVEG